MKMNVTKTSYLIIFIGPQGAGKTTQAMLLLKRLKSLNYDVNVTSLITYAFFHLKFISLLNKLCKTNVIMVKFYEDLPPQPSPSPEIYRRLFVLLLVLHFMGFMLSLIKRAFLKLFHEMLIEHEGFIFKQIADLYFLAGFVKIELNSASGKLLKMLSTLLLSSLLKERVIIIRLESDINSLKKRYVKRPHIEPTHYINFQNSVYRKLVKRLSEFPNIDVLELDSSQTIAKTHLNIVSSIQLFFEKG